MTIGQSPPNSSRPSNLEKPLTATQKIRERSAQTKTIGQKPTLEVKTKYVATTKPTTVQSARAKIVTKQEPIKKAEEVKQKTKINQPHKKQVITQKPEVKAVIVTSEEKAPASLQQEVREIVEEIVE